MLNQNQNLAIAGHTLTTRELLIAKIILALGFLPISLELTSNILNYILTELGYLYIFIYHTANLNLNPTLNYSIIVLYFIIACIFNVINMYYFSKHSLNITIYLLNNLLEYYKLYSHKFTPILPYFLLLFILGINLNANPTGIELILSLLIFFIFILWFLVIQFKQRKDVLEEK